MKAGNTVPALRRAKRASGEARPAASANERTPDTALILRHRRVVAARRRAHGVRCLVHAQQLESAVVPTAAQSHAFRIEAGRAAWYALAEALLPFGLDLSEDGDGKLAKPSNRSGYAFAASTCSALAKVRNDLMEAIRLGQVVPSEESEKVARRRAAELRQVAAQLDDTLQQCLSDALQAAAARCGRRHAGPMNREED